MTASTDIAVVGSSHTGPLIIALLALLVAGPWLFNKIWNSANRHVTQKVSPTQQRGNAALQRTVEFRIAEPATPSAVVDAVVSSVTTVDKPGLVRADVYIEGSRPDFVQFGCGKRLAKAWTAVLEARPTSSGVEGRYGISEASEADGLLWAVGEMERLETNVVNALRRHFPSAEFRVTR